MLINLTDREKNMKNFSVWDEFYGRLVEDYCTCEEAYKLIEDLKKKNSNRQYRIQCRQYGLGNGRTVDIL